MKFTNSEIVKELENRGYEAREDVVVKNSVEFNTINVKNSDSIELVIYPEKLANPSDLENLSLSEAVDIIIKIINTSPEVPCDMDKLKDTDFILSHIMMGVQKSSTQDLLKKASVFEGIEIFLYVRIDENCTMKLKENHIKGFQISLDEAWENAEKNTFKELEIKDMRTLINEMMGIDTDASQTCENDNPEMLVVSNKYRRYGAAAMLDGKTLKACAEILGVHNLYIIPSSIHEIIVISADKIDKDEVDEMVNTVNEQEVLEEEILSDRAYLVHIN